MILDDSVPKALDLEQNRTAAERIIPLRTSPEEGTDSPKLRRSPLYGPFYGLSESPFDLTPNPRFLFLPPRHREALANLRYGLTTPKGFMLLVGEAGTGKTTLIRTVLAEMGQSGSRCVFLHNPALQRDEFYEFLARELSFSAEATSSKARFLRELQEDAERRFAAGGLTTFIIDEAQSMPDDLLEEVRLMGNIESTTVKLLNIVLSGQPELAARLNATSLRQLKQRLALRCELAPFTADETAAYISGRLRIAGGTPRDIFTREAVVAIQRASRGIPRTINVICENALLSGFAAQAKPIPQELIDEVSRDFELGVVNEESPTVARADEAVPASPTRQEAETGRESIVAEKPMFSSLQSRGRRRFKFF